MVCPQNGTGCSFRPKTVKGTYQIDFFPGYFCFYFPPPPAGLLSRISLLRGKQGARVYTTAQTCEAPAEVRSAFWAFEVANSMKITAGSQNPTCYSRTKQDNGNPTILKTFCLLLLLAAGCCCPIMPDHTVPRALYDEAATAQQESLIMPFPLVMAANGAFYVCACVGRGP